MLIVEKEVLDLCAFLLVFELIFGDKAVFQTLRQLCFIRHPFWRLGAGIMITVIVHFSSRHLPGLILGVQGKGYPDLATRQLVRKLSDELPTTYALLRHRTVQSYMLCFLFTRVPVVALVDGDAHGLDIVSVYKFGSVALRHEASKLTAPRVECIGIWASELAS